ncbi:MAG TPA: cytochrome c biogenesis protein CcdA, partial [Sunxiuqinia sp.]|nr:cytochrome c biogenesis protein CcdA [Sunxiuqinia sp.]
MKMKRYIVFILLIFIAFQGYSQILNPVKWSFESKQDGKNAQLIFKATIGEGWHLYDTYLPEGGPVPTSINYDDSTKFEITGKLHTIPKPTDTYDKTFEMELRYFSNEATFIQPIKLKTDQPVHIKGHVEFMCCNDETCLPPTDADFDFTFNGAKEESGAAVSAPDQGSSNIGQNATKVMTDRGKVGSTKTSWLFFFFSILAGLAAILTPCVFPMIPMTVSFFMHSSKSKVKSRLFAAFYGISIIAIYTIVGTLVAVIFGPDAANWLSTHWLPNTLFFVIFVVFAFSFFGMFEITLPSWLVNKSDKQADRGGLLGSFFMALTLVLVSFSCTGPIVGAILVESAGGEILKPIVGMFGFSLAFALPFTLFALFPGWLSNLPKSGGWLNSVKVVL